MRSSLSGVITVLAFAGQAALLGWASAPAAGCGLDWALPTNHFDGVDDHGYVAYWEKIEEVDCGDGLKLPLYINFNSGRDGRAPSPYLGQGWILPLLESKFVQESEDRFVMTQPDGLKNLFLRAEPNGTVLNGSAGWKGEIRGDIITAWASCGWKIVFAEGRIASMTTPEGRKIDWVYEQGRVSELREASATRLKIEYDTEGQMLALAMGDGRRILLRLDKKPHVQDVNGRNVTVGVDNSLAELTLLNNHKHSYNFFIDDKMQSALKVTDIAGEKEAGAGKIKLLSWDPQTKFIAGDGRWTYQITPARVIGGTVAIARTDAKNHKEFWMKDEPNGQETIGTDDLRRTSTRFTAGPLAGRLQKIDETKDGKATRIQTDYYDETGNLIRERFSNGSSKIYNRDKSDHLLSIEERDASNNLLSHQDFDPKGRMMDKTAAQEGEKLFYADNGEWPLEAKEMLKLISPFVNSEQVFRICATTNKLSALSKKTFYNKEGGLIATLLPTGAVEHYDGTTAHVHNTYLNGVLLKTADYGDDGHRRKLAFFGKDGKTVISEETNEILEDGSQRIHVHNTKTGKEQVYLYQKDASGHTSLTKLATELKPSNDTTSDVIKDGQKTIENE